MTEKTCAELLDECAAALNETRDIRDRVLAEADRLVSIVHDRIYDETFDQKAASDAVWAVHNLIRPLIEDGSASLKGVPAHQTEVR